MAKAAGVDLKPFFFFDEELQNGIDDVLIFPVIIVLILIWTITDNIVQVTVYVKVLKLFYVLENGSEIFAIGFLLSATLKEIGIVRVLSVTQVRGANDKVKVVVFGKNGILTEAFRLKSQLHAKQDLDLICVFFL